MPPAADPPGLHIRPATPSDESTIRQMVRAARLDPTGLHWSHFVVGEQNGQVVGIGQVRPYPACRELGSLVVRPERRGQGIGAAIVMALLANEPGDVYLECAARLVPYYARFGFREIAWQRAPMPLKLKAGLGTTLGRLIGVRLVVMVRPAQRGQASEG